jgi:hypothetical protein
MERMEKQLTAVEWLVEKMTQQDFIAIPKPEWIEQAKAMEKEQMKEIFKQAKECAVKSDRVYFKHESFEQYYNETFKSE